MTTDSLTLLQYVTAAGIIGTLTLGILNFIRSLGVGEHIVQLHLLLNSRLSQLVETTDSNGHARGLAQGIQIAEDKAQRARDHDVSVRAFKAEGAAELLAAQQTAPSVPPAPPVSVVFNPLPVPAVAGAEAH